MKQYLEVGKLINTHGIKGEMKLELWCDSIDYIKQFKTLYMDEYGNNSLTLLSARPQKNHAIVKFAEITSIDEAENYKNKVLFGNRLCVFWRHLRIERALRINYHNGTESA